MVRLRPTIGRIMHNTSWTNSASSMINTTAPNSHVPISVTWSVLEDTGGARS